MVYFFYVFGIEYMCRQNARFAAVELQWKVFHCIHDQRIHGEHPLPVDTMSLMYEIINQRYLIFTMDLVEMI